MYLEFKDSFKDIGTKFVEWGRDSFAIDELNKWIDSHKDYKVTVIDYKVVYLNEQNYSQTCIFVEAERKEEPSKEEIPSKPEKPRALKLGWSI